MSRISVVIPMRNAERYINAAIDSILAQRGVEIEIVVVNDGSTDASAERVLAYKDPRVKMIAGPCKGIASALNAGLAAATGDYFARCDADDIYSPDRLASQKQWLEAHPDYGAVAGYFTMVNSDLEPVADQRWSHTAEDITQELQNGVGRTHLCAFLIRMDVMRDLEGFRPYFIGTEDADFQLRIGEVTKIWYEPRLCYIYRLHGESITHTQPTAEREFFGRVMREFQKQRRETGMDDLQRGNPPPVPANLSKAATHPKHQIQQLLLGTAWQEHRLGKKLKSISTGIRACLSVPGNFAAWKSLCALAIKRAGT
ncbi:MAG TPA: glycosyltransferase family 2 protein [Tepidisphaeraceae bacterium]|nr:glycosyltransferase family 2 protein [Tepidisphaeraceae bacterium]